MRNLAAIGFLIAVSLVPTLVAHRYHPELRLGPTPPLAEHEISLAYVRSLGGDVLWVDARTEEAFARGHVPGALSFDLADWEPQLNVLLGHWHSGLKIIVYCDAAGCDLSKQVAARLRDEVGLSDVYYLRGGWEAWQRQ